MGKFDKLILHYEKKLESLKKANKMPEYTEPLKSHQELKVMKVRDMSKLKKSRK